MKVMLVNPPARNYYGKLGLNLIPLGLAYIAAVLKCEGHQVEIVDLEVEPEKEAILDFRRFDLVGISADTPRFNYALKLAHHAKRQNAIVVMGGYHPTFLDRSTLESGCVDYVVRGEGEYILANLIRTLERGGDVANVQGLSYLGNGDVVRTPSPPFISNLDEIPFPQRDLFPVQKYLSVFDNRLMTTMLTSRGCPFDCYFCAASRFGGLKWRARSLDSIFAELEYLITQDHYSAFLFVDDNFTLKPQRVIDFCDEIIARRWDIRWWCFSRVDTIIRNEEMVKRMAQAGAKTVFLGLESGSQKVLDRWGKKITLEQQKQAVTILKKNGINVYGSFIIGDICETKRMIEHTIRYSRQLDLETCQFSLLTPYPGTRLFADLQKRNLLLTTNWDYYDGAHAVIKLKYLSPKQLHKLLAKAYRSFYLRLSNIPALIADVIQYPRDLVLFARSLRSGVQILRSLVRKEIPLEKANNLQTLGKLNGGSLSY